MSVFFDLIESTLQTLLGMSLTASIVIVAVIVMRMCIKKAPKWISCLLWGVVGLRLVVPFSFKSTHSILPSTEKLTSDIGNAASKIISGGAGLVDNTTSVGSFSDIGVSSVGAFNLSTVRAISVIWLVGVIIMLVYALLSYHKTRKSVKISMRADENIYICDRIGSPFILGVLRPKIYIPSYVSEDDRGFIIAHEMAHIKRLDFIWKPLAFIILSLHWFNPLCWAAYFLLCKDIEIACDEKVINNYNIDEKKTYSLILLNNSVSKVTFSACPLAFGEASVKDRVKNILNHKKPTVWIIIAALTAGVVASACLLTEPVNNNNEILGANYIIDKEIYSSNADSRINSYLFCITADIKNLFIRKNSNDRSWSDNGSLDKIDFSKDQLISILGAKNSMKYGFFEVNEAYRSGNYLIFGDKKGDVFIADASFTDNKVITIYSLYKLKSFYNKNNFDTVFYENTLRNVVGRNVYAFDCTTVKDCNIIAYLAGDSLVADEMTDIGYAVFRISKKGCKLIEFGNRVFARTNEGIAIFPMETKFADGKNYDLIISVNETIECVEQRVGDNFSTKHISGDYETLLFETDRNSQESKAEYRFFDRFGNETEY